MQISKSNQALILSVKRGYTIDRAGNVFSSKGKKLKPLLSSDGYKRYSINFYGKTVFIYFGRLQAYQKYGEKVFDSRLQVRHLNSNLSDDSWDNIALGTPSQNAMDKPDFVRYKIAVDAAQHVRVWTDEKLKDIFDDKYRRGFSYKDLREKYGIAKSTCSFLFNKSIFSEKYIKC